ncbi:MAG: type IV secretory system conjugative DNA transfer family protein [Planctomycetales bacterium]|nr:type IV secretory system conjugative DNA transfer family protein [Planctomycetales bacterium]MBN8626654.1 type IV secretory system conjugative DNA transfer family protein [Planctomycetota bacterium]
MSAGYPGSKARTFSGRVFPCYARFVLSRLATPADNVRGPQYLTAALTALHRSFRGRSPWELLIGRDAGQTGLYTRTSRAFTPLVHGQLQAAYPDLRIDGVSDDVFAPQEHDVCMWARLRLMPDAAVLVTFDQLVDRQEHQFVDPLAAVLTALTSKKGERLRPFVSVLVKPPRRYWKRRIRRQVGDAEKLRGAVWTVDVRVAVLGPPTQREAVVGKLHELAGVFAHFLSPGGGSVKLSGIRTGELPERLAWRRRWLLSPAELALLWHPPTQSVRTPQLRTNDSREFEPPPADRLPTLGKHSDLAVLGRTAFRDRRDVFGILPDDRFRHVYLIGQTGTGKSTLMLNLAAADIAAGRSVILLDPHGDLCDHLLSIVPPRRTNDVIVFDPSEPNPVGYNPLACGDRRQRALVASAVVTSFRRLFGDSWGPRLEHILRNCILTLLENTGTTLLSLHRLLTDEGYRKDLVGRLQDEVVRGFWLQEFDSWKPQFRAEAIAPVQNKVGALVTHPLLRNVLGDASARLDLRDVLDTGKALVCNLSKGRLGDDAANLLGSLLVAGAQLAAMSRADQPEAERVPAYLFVDEFQNFLTSETIPTLLSEMRKYRLAITIAHQHRGQLDEATAAAVFGNAGTLVAFRLGQDADVFSEQLGGDLLPDDLRSLPKYHAYTRLLIDGFPSRPFSMRTLPPPQGSAARKDIVRRTSGQRYG